MHFLREDLILTLFAALIFPLIAFVPGYVSAWITNVLDFRSQSTGWQFVIGVPISLAIVPIVSYWIDKLSGRTGVWLAFEACWCAFAILVAMRWRNRGSLWRLPGKTSAVFAGIALLWIAIALGSALDLPVGADRLYTSVDAADQSYRTELTESITRTGISHPVNPFYDVDGTAPLRYHYFWFILSSLVDQLGGAVVPPRHAFVASILWCGIGLGCMIACYLRFFDHRGATNIYSRTLKGMFLVAITGLDLIPTLTLARFHNTVYMDMEWWNEAVTSWLGTLLWAPHAIGALLAGLTAFLVLWHAASSPHRNQSRSQRWMAAALAGIALATMLGDSIYVAFVFALFFSIWTLMTFFAGWRNHTFILVAAGLIAVVLAIPYLKGLTGPASGGSFVQFTVRDFRGATAFGLSTEFPQPWKTYLARLALLPLNYLIELGFFLVVGILHIARVWSSKKFDPESAAAISLVLVSVATCTFLRSGVISNNDLGWRGFLPAQFVLLLWGVDYLRPERDLVNERSSALQAVLVAAIPALLVIGLLTSVYSLVVLRFSPIAHETADGASGKRAYAERIVYEKLRTILPPNAVVQQNPASENPVSYGLYSNRQAAAAVGGCATAFGGNARACDEMYPLITAVFSAEARYEDVDVLKRRLPIDALIVTNADPVWSVPGSWVWKRNPIVGTDEVRAYLITRDGK